MLSILNFLIEDANAPTLSKVSLITFTFFLTIISIILEDLIYSVMILSLDAGILSIKKQEL